jgi:hypothetical protein
VKKANHMGKVRAKIKNKVSFLILSSAVALMIGPDINPAASPLFSFILFYFV